MNITTKTDLEALRALLAANLVQVQEVIEDDYRFPGEDRSRLRSMTIRWLISERALASLAYGPHDIAVRELTAQFERGLRAELEKTDGSLNKALTFAARYGEVIPDALR